MNCQKFKHYINDTEAREAEDFDEIARRHLAVCVTCQTHFAAHVKLRHLLGNLEVIPAPPDFDARLVERLTSVQSRRYTHAFFDSFLFTPSLASVALSVVFVVFLGLVLTANLRHSDTEQLQTNVGNDIDAAASHVNSIAATPPDIATTNAPEKKVESIKPEVTATNAASTYGRTLTYKRISTPSPVTTRRRFLPLTRERSARIETAEQASRASNITRVANIEADATNSMPSNITDAASVKRGETKLDKEFERFGIYANVETGTQLIAQPDAQTVLRVTRVREKSVAAQAGIQIGDCVETVNDVPVGNLKAADIEALALSKNLRLNLRREMRQLDINLKSPE